MGSRGPAKGWKKQQDASAPAKATRPPARARNRASKAPKAQAPLSAADRENPAKLSGEALRKLAHNRGMAKSDLEGMADEKIREQLRYLTHRQYEPAEA